MGEGRTLSSVASVCSFARPSDRSTEYSSEAWRRGFEGRWVRKSLSVSTGDSSTSRHIVCLLHPSLDDINEENAQAVTHCDLF